MGRGNDDAVRVSEELTGGVFALGDSARGVEEAGAFRDVVHLAIKSAPDRQLVDKSTTSTDWPEGIKMWVKTKLFNDPTPGKVINWRIMNGPIFLLQHANLSEKDKLFFLHIQVLLAKKLIRIWRHLDAYNKEQNKYIELFINDTHIDSNNFIEREYSDELFLEFDEFLVQIKSTLDYLVKIPIPILGKNKWTLTTFGKEGLAVKKALANLPKELKMPAEGFSKFLIDRNKPWLDETINARDKINHFIEGGIDFKLFMVSRSPGSEQIQVPMWSPDQSVLEFMNVIWSNMLSFCEDFICLFLSLKFPPEITILRIPREIDAGAPTWKAISFQELEKMMKEKGLVGTHFS